MLNINNKNLNLNVILLILILLLSFSLRYLLKSNYLDDWDSVQFAMALNNYSVVLHQPHPPGYPVYIFVGRIFNVFIDNYQQSLILISIIFGTLAVLSTYFLGKYFFDKKTGLLAAILLSFSPASLLFSIVAMSDMINMFFITVVVLFFYLSIINQKFLYLSAIILGVTIGVRQTNLLLIPLFIFTLYTVKDLRKSLYAFILAIISLCVWLIPLIVDTGMNNLISTFISHGRYVSSISTLNLFGGPSILNIYLTLKELFFLFIDGWSISLIIFCIASGIIFGYYINKESKIIHSCKFLFLVIWLVPYFFYFIFDTYLSISRFLLPIFPAFAIIFAYSISESVNLVKNPVLKCMVILIFSGAIVIMGYQAVSPAYLLHNTPPAPVTAADFISNNYESGSTIIIGDQSYRHFQYYLPEFEVIYGPDPEDLYTILLQNKTLISEHELGFDYHDVWEFTRDHGIYPKHERVHLFIYPPDRMAVYGILGEGWYNQEMWGNEPSRWIKSDASLFLFSPLNQTINVTFNATSYRNPRTLEISRSDWLIGKYILTPDKVIGIDLSIELSQGMNELDFFIPEGCERPVDIPEIQNRDTRCISIGIQNLSITIK